MSGSFMSVLGVSDILSLLSEFTATHVLDAVSGEIHECNKKAGQSRLDESNTLTYLTDLQFRSNVSTRFADPRRQLCLTVRGTVKSLSNNIAVSLISSARTVKLLLYNELASSTPWFPLAEIESLITGLP